LADDDALVTEALEESARVRVKGWFEGRVTCASFADEVDDQSRTRSCNGKAGCLGGE
jgi:hypothetical protein